MSSNPQEPFQPVPASPQEPFQPVSGGHPGGPFAPAGPPPGIPAQPVEPVRVRPRRSGSSMLVNVLLGAALVVAVGGVAFAVGRATAPVATARGGFNGTGGNGQGGQGFFGPNASGATGRQGFGGIVGAGSISIQGTVEAIDGSSITIKTPSGASVTFSLNSDTTYHKQAAATSSDVTTGSTVIVQLAGRGGFQNRPNASAGPGSSGQPSVGAGAAGSVTVVPPGG